ncbi:MAG: hypothetical protein LBC12_00400 [Nitrososphaerota archaeon]|jgi:hypothetical protein|nr:hypothetical protein [Nitrososphaerota archaeon]
MKKATITQFSTALQVGSTIPTIIGIYLCTKLFYDNLYLNNIGNILKLSSQHTNYLIISIITILFSAATCLLIAGTKLNKQSTNYPTDTN